MMQLGLNRGGTCSRPTVDWRFYFTIGIGDFQLNATASGVFFECQRLQSKTSYPKKTPDPLSIHGKYWIASMAKRTSLTTRQLLRPRVKVWLEKRDEYVFGWGIAEILGAVEATGSIKEAAKKVGKSYRYVWSRVKNAENSIGRRLVETRVGGAGVQRSELTKDARDLLRNFTELRDAVMELVEQEFTARFRG